MLCISIQLNAKKIEVKKAQLVAQNFVEQQFNSQTKGDEVILVYTAQSDKSKKSSVIYYIFNVGKEQGFVIISGDDIARPVLGYATSGKFEIENMPPNFEAWMKEISNTISDAINRKISTNTQTSQEWETYLNKKADYFSKSANETRAVESLISTTWDQTDPYNSQCPQWPITTGPRCLAGSVATAMAQVMNYHGHPEQGTGSSTAYSTYTLNIPVSSVNFAVNYNFNNMGGATPVTSDQQSNVARLINHCGVSVHLDYMPSFTQLVDDYSVGTAVTNHFGYDKSLQLNRRIYYTDTQWINLIKKELNENRPVYYSGMNNNDVINAFVCDGYNALNQFRFNWGQSGNLDGFYTIDPIPNQFYPDNNLIFSGFKPNAGGTVAHQIYLVKDKNLTATETVVTHLQLFESAVIFTNAGWSVFPGGEAGIGLFTLSGNMVEVIGISEQNISSLEPKASWMKEAKVDCMVPTTVVPGDYLIKAITKANGSSDWIVARGTNVYELPLRVIVPGYFGVIVSANPTNGGTVAIDGKEGLSAMFPVNAQATVKATPKEGWNFLNWTDEAGNVKSANANYTFQVSDNIVLIANFEIKTYNVSISIDCGTTIDDTVTAQHGDNITITIPPKTGYHPTFFYVDGVNIPEAVTNGSYVLTVTANHSVKICYEINPTYTVTVIAGEGGSVQIMGHTSNTETFEEGTLVTVKATPNSGYTFKNWTEESTVVYTIATYPFNVVKNVTLTANFEVVYYTVTVSATEGGSAEIVGYPNQSASIAEGTSVTVKATANSGWLFTKWTNESGATASLLDTYTFTLSANISLKANFEPEYVPDYYTVTVIAAEGGSVEIDGYPTLSESIEEGTSVTVKAAANPSWKFTKWTNASGGTASLLSEYTFTVSENVTLTANFEFVYVPEFYTITVIALEGGSVEIVGYPTLSESIEEGTSLTVKATANTGWTFSKWTDESGTTASSSSNYSFTVSEDVTLTAHFTKLTYTVTAISNPLNGGQITGTGTFNYGESANIEAIPNSGYEFLYWTYSGNVVTDNPYIFTVTENITLTANFKRENTFIVTVLINPEGAGTVTGAGEYNLNEEVTLKANPNTGWDFVNWTDKDGEIITISDEYVFTITEDIVLTANFKEKTYTIFISDDCGDTFGEGRIVKHGETETVILTAQSGYHITFFYVDDVNIPESVASGIYTFVNVTSNHNVVVCYEINKSYTVTVIATEGGSVEIVGYTTLSETFDEGTNITVKATVNQDWKFKNWTDESGAIVSLLTTYPFSVTKNVTLTAHFEPDSPSVFYTVTVVANGNGTVEIVGYQVLSKLFEEGTQVTVKASANTGYIFVNWTDNNAPVSSLSSYSFKVEKDITLTANFREYSAEPLYTVGVVTAEEMENNVLVEWTQGPTYVIDDGTAEQGWRRSSNYEGSYGNKFNVGEAGIITSIDVYARHAADNTNRKVTINIYNSQRELIGSSAQFVLQGNGWVNVPLNSIPYTGSFYAMVCWAANSGQTHSLGYDTNGQNINEGLNWVKIGEYWDLLHELSTQAQPGVFMIRANVMTDGIPAKVGRGLEGYMVYRLTQGQPEANWTLLSATVAELSYNDTGWNSLQAGTYQYAVKARYTGDFASIPRFSNSLTKIPKYTVNVVANKSEYGYVTGAGTYEQNEKVTVGANPNPGYEFINWTRDGVEISKYIKHTFTIVENINLVANFRSKSGIDDNELIQFTIYPNPVSDILYITHSEANNARIEIYTIAGTLVMVQQIANNETITNIDVSALSTGSYLIQMNNETGISVQRFVKK